MTDEPWDWPELYLDRALTAAELGAALAGALGLDPGDVQAVGDIEQVDMSRRPRLVAWLTPFLGDFPLRVDLFRHDGERPSRAAGRAFLEALSDRIGCRILVDDQDFPVQVDRFILVLGRDRSGPVRVDPDAITADPPVIRLTSDASGPNPV